MANGWTQERCREQSVAIQRWKPWANSTGPRTNAGKAKASQNAYKGGMRPQLRRIAKALNKNQEALDELSTEDYDAMADALVAAALDGDFRAIQKIAEAIDE